MAKINWDESSNLDKLAELSIKTGVALQTGQELSISKDDIAEKTSLQAEEYKSELHFKAVIDVLDEEEPEYKN